MVSSRGRTLSRSSASFEASVVDFFALGFAALSLRASLVPMPLPGSFASSHLPASPPFDRAVRVVCCRSGRMTELGGRSRVSGKRNRNFFLNHEKLETTRKGEQGNRRRQGERVRCRRPNNFRQDEQDEQDPSRRPRDTERLAPFRLNPDGTWPKRCQVAPPSSPPSPGWPRHP
jgi:hypothetical protein